MQDVAQIVGLLVAVSSCALATVFAGDRLTAEVPVSAEVDPLAGFTGLAWFHGLHCGPCRRMEPIVARVEQGGVAVKRIDASRQPSLCDRLRVRQVPTTILVRAGEEVFRRVGFLSETELLGMAATLLPRWEEGELP